MRKTIIFSILVLGISSIIGQLVLIRELTSSFYGNEFFIGWIFFSWLFWVAMGSLFLNKLVKNENNLSKILVFCHIVIGVFLTLEIILSRLSRTLINEPSGQIPNLIPALLYAFLVICPLCLILGLQFNILVRIRKSSQGNSSLERISGTTYVLEAIGFIVGGLVFAYILTFVNEFMVVSIIAWINLLVNIFVLFALKKHFVSKFLTISLIVVFIGISIFSENINNRTNNFRFPHQELIDSGKSIYGNTEITKIGQQYNFYENGSLIGTNKEEFSVEEMAHISLLFHPDPQKILLIGNGVNGTLKEILKHHPSKVFYLELDPKIIELSQKYASSENQNVLTDKRINVINADARNFFKKNPNLFDVIILNLPNPSTALINRFYTRNFFEDVKRHLYPEGIFTLKLSSSPNYFGLEIKNLDASVFKALKSEFPSVLILPEDNHLFIASLGKIDYDYWPLFSRFITRGIETNFINKTYLEYRLSNDRVKNLVDELENNQAKINQDQLPVSYYYNFVHWIAVFHQNLAKFFRTLTNIKFYWMIAAILALSMIIILSRKRKNNTKNLFPVIMAISGFSLMAMEMIIILGFQVFYGYLYYKISLIITALMAGMALGSLLGTKKLSRIKIGTLIIIHSLIILFLLILLLGFYLLFENPPKPSMFIEITFLISIALIGGIVGFEFPIVNKLYLKNKNDTSKTGIIYGADLIGSCLGASLISIFILPIFGIYQTLILLGVLNFLIIISLIYLTSFSSKTWAVKT